MSTAETIRTGILELNPKGHGFLRDPSKNYRVQTQDVSIETALLNRYRLRRESGSPAPSSRRRTVRGRD